MRVILLADVEHVGLRGEVVEVKRGFARNFLLPRRLAEAATVGRVAEIARLEDQRARQEARSAEQADEIAAILRTTVLRFEVKAGPTGALFGSVTSTDIADEIWRTRKIRVDRRKIGLDTIKRIGRYSIAIDVFDGVTADVKTLVVPEGGELPPEEELAAMEAAELAATTADRAEPEGDSNSSRPLDEALESSSTAAPSNTADDPGTESDAAEEPAASLDEAVDAER